jgi:hypothetical protein
MTSVIRSDGTILFVPFPQRSKSKTRRPDVIGLVLTCRGSSRGPDRGLLRAANRGYRSLTQPL